MTIGTSAKLGFLLLTTMANGLGQNQTPANVPPPTWWQDSNTGLIWSLRDNGSDINQTDALSYCRDLGLAGFRDWRLPEVDELAQIYDASVVRCSFFFNGAKFDLHVRGGIRMTGLVMCSATLGNRSGEA